MTEDDYNDPNSGSRPASPQIPPPIHIEFTQPIDEYTQIELLYSVGINYNVIRTLWKERLFSLITDRHIMRWDFYRLRDIDPYYCVPCNSKIYLHKKAHVNRILAVIMHCIAENIDKIHDISLPLLCDIHMLYNNILRITYEPNHRNNKSYQNYTIYLENITIEMTVCLDTYYSLLIRARQLLDVGDENSDDDDEEENHYGYCA